MFLKKKHVKYSFLSIISIISFILLLPQAIQSDVSLIGGKSTFQLSLVPNTAISCDFINQDIAAYSDNTQKQLSSTTTGFNPWFSASLVDPQNANKPIDHFIVKGILENCKIPSYVISDGLTYGGSVTVTVSAYGSDQNQHVIFTQTATIPSQSFSSGTIILSAFNIPASAVSGLNTGITDIFTPINFQLNPTINFVYSVQGVPVPSTWNTFLSNGFTGKILAPTSNVLTSGCNASGSICVGNSVTNSQPAATGVQRATTAFRYVLAYTGNGAATSGIAQPSSGGLINIAPTASIVASSVSNQNPLYLFQITPLVKPQNPITSVQSSNIVYTGSISTNACANGGTNCANTIPIPSSSIAAIQSQVLDSDGTIELGTGTISIPALNSLLSQSGINTGLSAQQIYVTIFANGQFTGYYGSQKYTGVVTNAAVTMPLLYSSSSTTIAPVGLSGNSALDIPIGNMCTASQIVAGYTTVAGQCVPPAGGTPKVCVDPQGNPDPTCTKVGTSASCSGLGALNPACNTNAATYCATHSNDALCNPVLTSTSQSNSNPISSILVCGAGGSGIIGCGNQPNPSTVTNTNNNGAAMVNGNPSSNNGNTSLCTDTNSLPQCLSEQSASSANILTVLASLLQGDTGIYLAILVILIFVLIIVLSRRHK